MDEDDYYPDFPHIAGMGSMHGLADAEEHKPSRLYGLRSVSAEAECAYRQKPKTIKRHPIGFHRPR